MEFINKVELQGIVGSSRVSAIADKKLTFFNLAVNHCYKNDNGDCIVETTWLQVESWADIPELSKGDCVRVEGRLRTARYTNSAGEDRTQTNVVADKVEIVGE